MLNTKGLTSIAAAVLLLAGRAMAAPFAYITNSNGGENTVSVIELATNTVVATVPVGPQPTEVAVNRAGTRAYVTNFDYDGPGSVSVVDTGSNSVVATITVGHTPFGVSVNAAGTRVYVANSYEGSVSVIDTATNTVTATVAIPDGSSTITVTPDGNEVYVAGTGGGCYGSVVSVIDAGTNTVTATVPIADGTCAVSAAPDGRHVYVATRAGISVIDTATHNAATIVRLPQAPAGLALNPAGTRVFTANFGDGTGSTVSVVDVATGTVAATVDVDERPLAVAVDPTGAHAYVVHNTNPGIVTIIDAVTGIATGTVLVGNGPSMFGHEFIGSAPTAGGGVTTTTSSTTTTSTTSVSLLPCAKPRCVLDAALSGPCGHETVPQAVRGQLIKALYFLDEAGIATGRKAARLRKKAGRIFAAADHLSRRAALKPKPQLSVECASGLGAAISGVRAGLGI